MTKQEFINRAIVKVTDKEFEAINAIYMASDLDKDQFCAMWRKANKSRVDQTKAAQRRVKQLQKQIEKLHKITDLIDRLNWNERNIRLMSSFTDFNMEQTLENNGIDIWFKTPATVREMIVTTIETYEKEIKAA